MEEDIYIEELMASIPEDLDSISINKCVFNFSESLEFLPSELIAMIVEYLPKEDILKLRSLGNKNLSRATDHSFVSKRYSRGQNMLL
ncbi:hypothetical protein ACET3X_002157 [Alternaria dauci]|uniref:F-box domain-containing protein n=1 Tax=Alternaria dauci TaxID=48095 RepID=A0ABR3UNQ8_9PLEO